MTHKPWCPGNLLNGVTYLAPKGVSQQLIMLCIGRTLGKANANPKVLDDIEATISITDDAIHHMMRKR